MRYLKRSILVAALVAACGSHKPNAKPDAGSQTCVLDTSKLDGCFVAP
jgi:hypothetical protein